MKAMQETTLGGKVARVLGIACLICAGIIAFMQYSDAHRGVWFAGLANELVWAVAGILVALGLWGIIYANRSGRTGREVVVGLGLGQNSDGGTEGRRGTKM
jgi:hypothetical protein